MCKHMTRVRGSNEPSEFYLFPSCLRMINIPFSTPILLSKGWKHLMALEMFPIRPRVLRRSYFSPGTSHRRETSPLARRCIDFLGCNACICRGKHFIAAGRVHSLNYCAIKKLKSTLIRFLLRDSTSISETIFIV